MNNGFENLRQYSNDNHFYNSIDIDFIELEFKS